MQQSTQPRSYIPGPAHAVYFGTYEIVKEAAGGNATDGKHHPLAAGMQARLRMDEKTMLTSSSCIRSRRNYYQRCSDEPI